MSHETQENILTVCNELFPSFTDAKWRLKKNYIPMIKMDCQLINSKRIFIKKSSIPPNLMDMSYLYAPFVNNDDRN